MKSSDKISLHMIQLDGFSHLWKEEHCLPIHQLNENNNNEKFLIDGDGACLTSS